MFTFEFWKAATERALKTAAQVILATYFVGDVVFNALQADWANMAGIGVGGLLLSYLSSIASGYNDGNPSAVNAETTKQGRHEAGDPDEAWDGVTL